MWGAFSNVERCLKTTFLRAQPIDGGIVFLPIYISLDLT